MFQAWISLLNNEIYISQPPTANKHHHKLLEIDSHVTSANNQSSQHHDTSVTPPRRTKQKTSVAKQEYPHFDAILPFQDHSTLILYLLYHTNFYTIIVFNSPTTVVILNWNFTDVHEISLTKTKHCMLYSLPYNKKVFNLMMAYRKTETCSCWDKLCKKTS